MLLVNQLNGFGARSAEGNDAFTKLFLHCDGSDGSSSFPDASSAVHTVTATGTTAPTVRVAQSKFGGASASMDGGWLTSANNSDWDFGTGDFTLDWWEYRTSLTAGKCAMARAETGTFVAFLAGYSSGTNNNLYLSSNNSSWDIANGVDMGTVATSTWNHFAVSRNGNNFYTFKNGTQISTFSSSASLATSSASLSVGSAQQNLSVLAFTGYLDEVRISKGIARWVASFTPPSAAYG